jgi:hypothetical protein
VSQPAPSRHAPRLGEHTVDVLMDAGFDRNIIDSLLERGVIKQPEP